MGEVIGQRELRNDSGRIMRGLDEGKTYILTRNSVPVGEVRPLRRQRMVASALVAEVFRGAPAIDYATFRNDVDIVDHGIEPRG